MNLKIVILSFICFLSFEAVAQRVTLPRIQRADGAGYIPYTDANGKQTYQLLDTLVTGGDIGSGVDSFVAVWLNDTLTSGIIYDDGEHVGINASESLTGLLTTKAQSYPVLLESDYISLKDSFNNNVIRLTDYGRLYFGNNAFTDAPYIIPFNTSPSVPASDGRGIGFRSKLTSATRTGFNFSNDASITMTSGVSELMRINYTYAPTSGTNAFAGLELSPTINQTGTADGITRGVYVTPTLTSSSSWRSFETNVTSGYGFLSSGAALNVLAGNTKIGTSGDPVRDLEVDGELRVTADVDTAEQELIWAGNNEGDLNRLIVGEGLTVSGDSLIGDGTTYTEGTNILIAGDSISADIKWPHWDGGIWYGSTYTFDSLTTSLDTFDFPGDLHIGEGITYSAPLTAYGSSYAGFEFEQSGTYQMTWTADYETNFAVSNGKVEYNWHINGSPIDAFNSRHVRRWPSELTAGTNVIGTSTIQFNISAGQYLQLCMRTTSVSLTELEARGFHIQIHKIRD